MRVFFGGLMILLAWGLSAQVRPAWLDQNAQLVYPTNYDARRSYPLIIWLPYTGGTAFESFSFHQNSLPSDEFLVLLPPGRPLREHYLPAFDRFVGWYEDMLLRTLGSLVNILNKEPSAVVVVGHSLGGDLAWALTVRNPHLFNGVVLSGTRASHRFSLQALETLRRANTKFYFFLGQREDRTRRQGMLRAIDELQQNRIIYFFHELPNRAHELPPYADFVNAIRWVLKRES